MHQRIAGDRRANGRARRSAGEMMEAAKVRVAQVIDSLLIGGKERVALLIANQLAEMGFQSYLIETRSPGPLREHLSPKVRAHSVGRSSRWNARGAVRLAMLLDQLRLDIVQTHNRSTSYLYRLIHRLIPTPPVHVVHDHHGPALGDKRLQLLDRVMLRGANAYVAVTEALRDQGARVLRLPQSHCIYLTNGIEVQPPREPWHGRPTVVQVANIHPVKGHLTALRAAAILRTRVPDVRWLFIGSVWDPEGAYFRELSTLIREHRLEGCVEMLGRQTDVRPFLREASVGVLTSEAEGLPMALLEYLAAQLPVVITNVGQGPAIVQQSRSGVVVEPGKPGQLADALSMLLLDPSRRELEGRRGRRFAEEYLSMQRMGAELSLLYERLLPDAAQKATAREGIGAGREP